MCSRPPFCRLPTCSRNHPGSCLRSRPWKLRQCRKEAERPPSRISTKEAIVFLWPPSSGSSCNRGTTTTTSNFKPGLGIFYYVHFFLIKNKIIFSWNYLVKRTCLFRPFQPRLRLELSERLWAPFTDLSFHSSSRNSVVDKCRRENYVPKTLPGLKHHSFL